MQRRDATWQDYVAIRDSNEAEWRKIAFHEGWLLVDMGTEGPNHASFSDLITAVCFAWAFLNPDIPLQSYGRCLIENPETPKLAHQILFFIKAIIFLAGNLANLDRIVAPGQRFARPGGRNL